MGTIYIYIRNYIFQVILIPDRPVIIIFHPSAPLRTKLFSKLVGRHTLPFLHQSLNFGIPNESNQSVKVIWHDDIASQFIFYSIIVLHSCKHNRGCLRISKNAAAVTLVDPFINPAGEFLMIFIFHNFVPRLRMVGFPHLALILQLFQNLLRK